MFGTETITDWKAGDPIIWKGVWQGKTYEDKGEILRIVPEKLLETTYWSSMAGLSDKPAEKDKNHSEQNWKMALDGLKNLLEK